MIQLLPSLGSSNLSRLPSLRVVRAAFVQSCYPASPVDYAFILISSRATRSSRHPVKGANADGATCEPLAMAMCAPQTLSVDGSKS
jgi:hypothetical protein